MKKHILEVSLHNKALGKLMNFLRFYIEPDQVTPILSKFGPDYEVTVKTVVFDDPLVFSCIVPVTADMIECRLKSLSPQNDLVPEPVF